ncbi:hypothetical protein R6H00_07690, partial [Actinotignum timonense]
RRGRMDREVHGSPGVPRGPQGGVLSTRSASSRVYKRDQRGCGQRVRHHEYSYTAAAHHGAANTSDYSANHAAHSERASYHGASGASYNATECSADDSAERASNDTAHGAAEHTSGNSTGQHAAKHPAG